MSRDPQRMLAPFIPHVRQEIPRTFGSITRGERPREWKDTEGGTGGAPWFLGSEEADSGLVTRIREAWGTSTVLLAAKSGSPEMMG